MILNILTLKTNYLIKNKITNNVNQYNILSYSINNKNEYKNKHIKNHENENNENFENKNYLLKRIYNNISYSIYNIIDNWEDEAFFKIFRFSFYELNILLLRSFIGGIIFYSSLTTSQFMMSLLSITTKRKSLASLFGFNTILISSYLALAGSNKTLQLIYDEIKYNSKYSDISYILQSTQNNYKYKNQKELSWWKFWRKSEEWYEEKNIDPYSIILTGPILFKLLGGRFFSIAPSDLRYPGAFHYNKGSLPAGLDYATGNERNLIKAYGDLYGCHSCGKKNKIYHADHIPPRSIVIKKNNRLWRKLLNIKIEQKFFPQCNTCSNKQGNALSILMRKKFNLFFFNSNKFTMPDIKIYHYTSIRLYHFTGFFLIFLGIIFSELHSMHPFDKNKISYSSLNNLSLFFHYFSKKIEKERKFQTGILKNEMNQQINDLKLQLEKNEYIKEYEIEKKIEELKLKIENNEILNRKDLEKKIIDLKKLFIIDDNKNNNNNNNKK